MEKRAEIGVLGGSGFYSMDGAREIRVYTPYGIPSDNITLTTIGGKRVAFLPRHGKKHQIPPHMINYRANLWAMKELGVTRVIGTCAAGSLQAHIKPGDFVICDQFIDHTYGRKDTFYDGPNTIHISTADPYCPEMRKLAIEKAKSLGITVHETGTVVVIQGPRLSTRAESKWFGNQGWEIINMTQYPECVLARELGMCFVNISLITDFDVGLEGNTDIIVETHEKVMDVLNKNFNKLHSLLHELISALPEEINCSCYKHLLDGRID